MRLISPWMLFLVLACVVGSGCQKDLEWNESDGYRWADVILKGEEDGSAGTSLQIVTVWMALTR